MSCSSPMGKWESIERARILARDRSPGSEGIRSYRCRKCSGWHLTSAQQWSWWKRAYTYVRHYLATW